MSPVDFEVTWRRVRAVLRKGGGTVRDIRERDGDLTEAQVVEGLAALQAVNAVRCVDDIWWLT